MKCQHCERMAVTGQTECEHCIAELLALDEAVCEYCAATAEQIESGQKGCPECCENPPDHPLLLVEDDGTEVTLADLRTASELIDALADAQSTAEAEAERLGADPLQFIDARIAYAIADGLSRGFENACDERDELHARYKRQQQDIADDLAT